MDLQKHQPKLGKVTWELIAFSIPLILSAVLQQLYNWADALIVGNVEGELALGAIGGTGTVNSFFVMLIVGFCTGIGVLAAQKYGSGDMPFVQQVLGSFEVILGGAGILLAVAGSFLTGPMLRLLDTPADTFAMAESYLRIILLGIPFLAVYNVYSAVIRGVGDSRAPFFSVLVSSGINIVLDLILVAWLRLGIMGAAAATVASQIMMTVYMVTYAHRKHPEAMPVQGKPRLVRAAIRRGMALGLPPMLQSCISSFGNLVLQSFMNSFGTATVIAITTAYRVDTLAMMPVINTASAIATLTAQSCGAGDRARMHQVRKAGMLVMLGVSAALTVLVIPFGSRLIALFGAGEEAVQIGHDFFVRLACFYVAFGFYNAIRGYLEGIGDVTFASMLGIAMLAIRIAGSYAFVGLWGNMVIAFAEGIAWSITCILYLLRLRYVSHHPYAIAPAKHSLT